MARTTGPTVMLPVDADRVAAMLPEGLELHPQSATEAGQHPVILLFGRQRNVRPNQWPFGMNYCEFICAVPWVRHSDPALQNMPPLIVPTRLYLDSLPPILLGIYGYGFPKERAAIFADPDSYIIRDHATNEELISCHFTRAGSKTRAHDLRHFDTIRQGYEMAMVNRNKLGMWQYAAYDFSLGQAELEPLEMEIRIATNALGLPQGVFKTPSIATSNFGAMFVTADAIINNPLQSFNLRRTLRELAK